MCEYLFIYSYHYLSLSMHDCQWLYPCHLIHIIWFTTIIHSFKTFIQSFSVIRSQYLMDVVYGTVIYIIMAPKMVIRYIDGGNLHLPTSHHIALHCFGWQHCNLIWNPFHNSQFQWNVCSQMTSIFHFFFFNLQFRICVWFLIFFVLFSFLLISFIPLLRLK